MLSRMKTKLFTFVALGALGHVMSCLPITGPDFLPLEASPFYVLPEHGFNRFVLRAFACAHPSAQSVFPPLICLESLPSPIFPNPK